MVIASKMQFVCTNRTHAQSLEFRIDVNFLQTNTFIGRLIDFRVFFDTFKTKVTPFIHCFQFAECQWNNIGLKWHYTEVHFEMIPRVFVVFFFLGVNCDSVCMCKCFCFSFSLRLLLLSSLTMSFLDVLFFSVLFSFFFFAGFNMQPFWNDCRWITANDTANKTNIYSLSLYVCRVFVHTECAVGIQNSIFVFYVSLSPVCCCCCWSLSLYLSHSYTRNTRTHQIPYTQTHS